MTTKKRFTIRKIASWPHPSKEASVHLQWHVRTQLNHEWCIHSADETCKDHTSPIYFFPFGLFSFCKQGNCEFYKIKHLGIIEGKAHWFQIHWFSRNYIQILLQGHLRWDSESFGKLENSLSAILTDTLLSVANITWGIIRIKNWEDSFTRGGAILFLSSFALKI